MKINCSIEIDAPIAAVSDAFQNRDNMKHWHPDLVSITPEAGEIGEPGSVARLKFKKFDLIETVVVNDLPREYSGEYLTEGICWNSMTNSFVSLSDSRTRYDAEVEYRMIGTFVKIMAWIMPGMFKSQVQKSMERFKKFVEDSN